MPKRHPEERWRDYVLEGYRALVASNEFKQLRRNGLKTIGRERLLADHEWGELLQSGLTGSPEYRSFREECSRLAKQYGLAQWTVEAVCLVSRYAVQNASTL